MRDMYRKAVRHISRRYDESAWYRLGFLLITVGVFHFALWLLMPIIGNGAIAAFAVVCGLLTYSAALAFIIVSGDWAHED